MLFSRRKRLDGLAAREAAGENLWRPEFDGQARTKLVHLLRSLCREQHPGQLDGYRLRLAYELVLRDEGLFFLHDRHVASIDTVDDLVGAVLHGDVDMVATIIEAAYTVLVQRELNPFGLHRDLVRFEATMSTILLEHRVAFDLIDGNMVPFESRQMHEAVVAPTLTLLGGRSGWEPVETSFRKALDEIGKDPTDAITDVGTALQEALKALGCEGNALGPLGVDAAKRGVLTGYDRKIIDWVAADRSIQGDGHNADCASPADAWLAVHVVGALILRLAEPGSRSG